MITNELEVFLQTHNRQETADHFGVHLATVKRAIKRLGIKYKKKSGGHPDYRNNPLSTDIVLAEEQQYLMTGSLLGDGFLLGSDIFRIKQKKTRREYIEFLHEKFAPFSTPVRIDKARKPTRINGKVSHRIEDWKGGHTWSASFSTRKHQIFHDLRAKWYPDGVKTLPDDLALNPTIVTHWYLQDGSYSKKFGMIRFSCEGFDEHDIAILIDLLKSIGISSKLAKNQSYNVIDVYDDHIKLMNMMVYRPSCFAYKFTTT
jgi:hypothetical protein